MFLKKCWYMYCTFLAIGKHNVDAFAFSPMHTNVNSLSTTHTSHTSHTTTTTTTTTQYSSTASSSADDFPIDLKKSFVLTEEEVAPLVKFNKESGKEKWINAYGIVFMIASAITLPLWWTAMMATETVCNAFPDLDPHRSVYDATGKVWAKGFLALTNSSPSFSGDLERLEELKEPQACLYVANHASWLDIPVICTVLSPVFKFIAKGELLKVPCIGKQLKGGNHILIDREDRRSQLRTFKEGVSWLGKGVPLMAFPEGKRSDDGKLMEFKGGIFSMAVRAKVPIVPLSISNTHAIMPANALLPFQSGAGKLHVHIHPPIDVEGEKEDELADMVRTALLSKMPLDQHPVVVEEQNDASDDGDVIETKDVTNNIKVVIPDNAKENNVKI